MVEKIASNIYKIVVRLEGSPLKNLNSYLFTSADRNLLVDTGFNQPACLEDLQSGIDKLGLDMHKTDLFLTHFHSDHCGLVSQIASSDTRIYMSETDLELFRLSMLENEAYWMEMELSILREGFPQDELMTSIKDNPAKELVDNVMIPAIPVHDGDIIKVGEKRLVCVSTPGHTPGHMCLYDENSKSMILGDHVLFDITPNITPWASLPNTLSHYLNSLKMIKTFDVELPLPAHRACNNKTFTQRIDELISHHKERLNEAESIVEKEPGLTAYMVASKMSWAIRAKSWEDFPATQKWFAVGEAISHLDYLVAEGRLLRTVSEGVHHYTKLI